MKNIESRPELLRELLEAAEQAVQKLSLRYNGSWAPIKREVLVDMFLPVVESALDFSSSIEFNTRVAEEVTRIHGETHAIYKEELRQAHAKNAELWKLNASLKADVIAATAETEAYRCALREIANRTELQEQRA